MNIPINIFLEINPPSNTANYNIIVNDQTLTWQVLQEFDDEITGGHIIEYFGEIEIPDDSKQNNILISVKDNLGILQVREVFIDNIKMDHVLLLATKVHKGKETFDGTQIKGSGSIVLTFDLPIWSWWCKHLRSVEVIENVGYQVKEFYYE